MTAGTMGRTGSSEGRPDAIPLETRVLHLLALGHLGFREIQAKVKGPEEQLRQVLNSVRSCSGLHRLLIFTWVVILFPSSFSLFVLFDSSLI